MNETIKYFLQDLTELLYERAKEARSQCEETKSDNAEKMDFECGRALGYYEVLSSFVSLAKTFNIPSDMIDLSKIDPEQLLR